MISPCIDILRRLATHINHDLGARQGSKHTSPDLQADIQELMDVLAEFGVYEKDLGRTIETDKPVIINAVSAGLTQLAGPLADFNSQLRRLQNRCTMTPVVGTPYVGRPPPAATSTSSDAEPVPSTTSTNSVNPAPHDTPSTATIAATSEMPAPDTSDLDSIAAETAVPDLAAVDDDETLYWAVFDEDEEERTPFSLDSAEDVALDMDVLEGD